MPHRIFKRLRTVRIAVTTGPSIGSSNGHDVSEWFDAITERRVLNRRIARGGAACLIPPVWG